LNEKLYNYIVSGDVDKFYNSRTWRKKRTQTLERDNKECQKCKRRGKFNKATCVHHKKHLRDNPELALIDDNLESLCDICHNEEHPEKFEHKKKILLNEEKW